MSRRNNYHLLDNDNKEYELIIESDVSDEQWKFEKKMFFKGLDNNKYEIFDDSIHVYYKGTEHTNDPRTIYYKFGDNRLADDHCCIQHSKPLCNNELRYIFHVLKQNGVDVRKYDIYYEIYNRD